MARSCWSEKWLQEDFRNGVWGSWYGHGSLHDPWYALSRSGTAIEGSVSVAFRLSFCITLILTSGLTAYNHNLDTSREFYPSVMQFGDKICICLTSYCACRWLLHDLTMSGWTRSALYETQALVFALEVYWVLEKQIKTVLAWSGKCQSEPPFKQNGSSR